LSDDAALESIVAEILVSSDLENKIIVDTTTVHPDTTAKVSSKLTSMGVLFLAGVYFLVTVSLQLG